MRTQLLATSFLILAAASPAAADTMQEVAKHGMTVTFHSGAGFEITFTPDGKFTGLNGQISGSWRIDGDKVCTRSATRPDESCTPYPADKKSGDTFDVNLPLGLATVKIN
jgi:hypothetical protein